jgi:peroxiredoxin Q/BCP
MKTGKIITALMALALVFLNHVANAEPSATLTVGQPAPDFNLPDQNGKTRTLADFRGKWLVLYFYVKDDTPESTEQARGFRDYIPELPLLADSKGEMAARYHSLEGDGSPGNPGNLAKRNTFLIDPQGRIAKIYLSASPSRNPIEVIEDLKRVNGF